MRKASLALAIALAGAGALAVVAQEVKTVDKGIEIQNTSSILNAAAPFTESEEKCANASAGFSIIPESVKATVVDTTLTDPGGNMDEKPIKAEARTRLTDNNTKICMKSYCEAGVAYQCMIKVSASWQEKK